MPIFKGLQSNRYTCYQKILLLCSLGCKKLWNFVCLPMKFHNRHHATVHEGKKLLRSGKYDSNFAQNTIKFLWCDAIVLKVG